MCTCTEELPLHSGRSSSYPGGSATGVTIYTGSCERVSALEV